MCDGGWEARPDCCSDDFAVDRTGKYSGHSGPIIQLLRLGEVLLSLGADRKLVVWDIGTYEEPQVLFRSEGR